MMRIRLHHICLVAVCSMAAGDAFDLSCNSEEVCSAEWDAIGGAQKYLMFFANSTGTVNIHLFVKAKNASRVPLSLPCDAKISCYSVYIVSFIVHMPAVHAIGCVYMHNISSMPLRRIINEFKH